MKFAKKEKKEKTKIKCCFFMINKYDRNAVTFIQIINLKKSNKYI